MSPETRRQLKGEKQSPEKSFTLIGKNQQAADRGEGVGDGWRLVALLETSMVMYLLSLLYNDELRR